MELASIPAQRRRLDLIEAKLVREARRGRYSWEEIGGALGMTKSAAHHRFGHLDPPGSGRARAKRGGRDVRWA